MAAVKMTAGKLPQKYTEFQAWLHDHIIADRALNLHAYILERTQLTHILAEEQHLRVLDVGCGGGQTLIGFRERYPHLRLTGIDLSVGQIVRARQRSLERGYRLEFEIADAQALPFPEASFDVVISFGSAKHWPDPLRGVAECWRVLQPGGELLITDATSDATKEQVVNFYRISQFPRLFQGPITALLYKRMFLPTRSMETYHNIAAQLEMPDGAVSHLPSMPAFVFRTQKPALPS